MKSYFSKNRVLLLLGAVFLLSGCYKEIQEISPESVKGEFVSVDFVTPGIGSETEIEEIGTGREKNAELPATRAVALEDSVTVRIIAYRKANNNPSSDNYVEDLAYVMRSGSLVPCTVDENGNYKADSDSRMRLEAGDYDFYAITPALPLGGDKVQVSVTHGIDYAFSVTPSFEVAANTKPVTVTLKTLERQCSQLSFSTVIKGDRIAEMEPHSIRVGKLTSGPVLLNIGEEIPLGSDNGSYCFPESAFVEGAGVGQYSCVEEVLPSSESFSFSMSLTFNDAPWTTELTTGFVDLPFEKGKRYNFAIELENDKVLFKLQITPWNETGWVTPNVGGSTTTAVATFVVGSWEISGWTTDISGHFVPEIDLNSWVSHEWSSDIAS